MHSRIFELSTAEYFDVEGFQLTPSSLFDDMGKYGIDYVTDETNREEDILWLFDSLKDKPYIETGKDDKDYYIELKKNARKELAKEIWAELNNLYNEYAKAIDTDFEHSSEGLFLHRMKQAISDDFSFKYWDGCILTTFQNFVSDNKPGRFYIGNTLDYHY